MAWRWASKVFKAVAMASSVSLSSLKYQIVPFSVSMFHPSYPIQNAFILSAAKARMPIILYYISLPHACQSIPSAVPAEGEAHFSHGGRHMRISCEYARRDLYFNQRDAIMVSEYKLTSLDARSWLAEGGEAA